ncbi:MAG: TraR/DksA family transcriptional regulator [Desulfobacterales bacterium]
MRDDIDIAYFKKRLEERLAEIDKDLAGGRQSAAPVELDQARVGRVSRMDAMQQQAMAQAAQRSAKTEKMRVYKALDRIRSGDFGYCMNCDEEIAEKRLRFDPSVLFCVECARAAESR